MQPTWQSDCGTVQLYLADCLDVLPHLSAVDAVVTDPPYGICGGSGGDARNYKKGAYEAAFSDTPDYIKGKCVPAIKAAILIAESVAVTPGNRCLMLYPQPRDIGCFWTPAACTHGPWGMTTFQPILYYGSDWRAGRGALPSGKQITERSEVNGHPCPKPIGAWMWLLDKTCRPRGTTLDPFMGSGTTGVAAVRLGRKFIGIEIDECYFAIAKRRIVEALNSQPLFKDQEPTPTQRSLLCVSES